MGFKNIKMLGPIISVSLKRNTTQFLWQTTCTSKREYSHIDKNIEVSTHSNYFFSLPFMIVKEKTVVDSTR